MTTLYFKNESPNESPKYACEGDSGFDLRAWIKTDECEKPFSLRAISLEPLERRLIHTGIYLKLPPQTEIQVRTRSGLALKRGLVVLNSPGTVDEKYRGEVCVIVINLSNKVQQICHGDRIAQAVLMPVFNNPNVRLEEVDEISTDTERGDGGFGHSGKK